MYIQYLAIRHNSHHRHVLYPQNLTSKTYSTQYVPCLGTWSSRYIHPITRRITAGGWSSRQIYSESWHCMFLRSPAMLLTVQKCWHILSVKTSLNTGLLSICDSMDCTGVWPRCICSSGQVLYHGKRLSTSFSLVSTKMEDSVLLHAMTRICCTQWARCRS